jgi:hypothetical protein
VGRYWPGKPLREDEDSSSEEEEDEEGEGEETQERPENHTPSELRKSKEDKNSKTISAAKLVTTMKTAMLVEQGPYMQPDEESSESESEEDESSLPERRSTKLRQANRRAIGDFVATDKVDLEEEVN